MASTTDADNGESRDLSFGWLDRLIVFAVFCTYAFRSMLRLFGEDHKRAAAAFLP